MNVSAHQTMKHLLLILLTIAALSAAPSVFAQDLFDQPLDDETTDDAFGDTTGLDTGTEAVDPREEFRRANEAADGFLKEEKWQKTLDIQVSQIAGIYRQKT